MTDAGGRSLADKYDRADVALPGIDVVALRSKSLGNSTYFVTSDGEAIVVDPVREIDLYSDLARERDARITKLVETHVHSDYVSGALPLARRTGAEVVAPGLGKYEFGYREAWEDEEVVAGSAVLRSISTPGHTYDHL